MCAERILENLLYNNVNNNSSSQHLTTLRNFYSSTNVHREKCDASRGVLTRRTSSGATGYVLLSAFDENNGYEMYFPRSVVDGAS